MNLKLFSYNPAIGKIIWKGCHASKPDIDKAIASARNSFTKWSRLSLEERYGFLKKFGDLLKAKQASLAEAISMETGKPLWESLTEVAAMIGKVDLSYESYQKRCPTKIKPMPAGQLVTRHKPHGVVAVFGPFNFPGHLPNGHIIPALLAGNTIVFKPSEYTPLVGEMTARLWQEAGLPEGVLNLVQGGRQTGIELSSHPALDGLFFTGSWPTGKALSEAFSARPEKILALEMGGNNPLVVSKISDAQSAAYTTVVSAYLTSGQRCSCARRLIVIGDPKNFLSLLQEMIQGIRIGAYNDNPEPFMGPVISYQAAEKILLAQEHLKSLGGIPLVEMKQLKLQTGFLSPGLIDVTHAEDLPDEEIFGPFLQVIRVSDFEAAILEANRTRYGLTAAS